MEQQTRLKQNKNKEYPIEVTGAPGQFEVRFEKKSESDGIYIFHFEISAPKAAVPPPLALKWNLPAHNVKGVWTTNALHEKRLRADWEAASVESRVSVDAPVLCLFGHDDANIQTFACSDVINTLRLEAPVREEDNLIYCKISLFNEKMPETTHYAMDIRVDTRTIHFADSLADVSNWWAEYETLQPMEVFEDAKMPLYSTWYAYHQNLSVEALLTECRLSAKHGYKLIIVDDGWQTMDTNRGYDYTGDWRPERLPDMAELVKKVHELEMKLMLWFSVPFCGLKSDAYQRFKGKFLTENHRWAPVFDPRYPEVRQYLIDIYVNALKTWNLDGFKLDFIDDFKVYPETILTKENGRDYASVNEAVDRLMNDVMKSLRAIKPDILIEFRQKYIGPAMRKYGNMFRAFDCPNDSLTNRIRTTDVRLLCGNTAVHSDMFTWHRNEPVEIAALQFANIIFSVPQLSVRMENLPDDYVAMIDFYSRYWLDNRTTLMDGDFIPFAPLANYPILSAAHDEKIIYGVYENIVVEIEEGYREIDLINGKIQEQIVFEIREDMGDCQVKIYNCQGNVDWESVEAFEAGVHALEVPPCGIIKIRRQ